MRKVNSFYFRCPICTAGQNLFIDSFLEPNNSFSCKSCGYWFANFKSIEIPDEKPKPKPKLTLTKQTETKPKWKLHLKSAKGS